MIERNLSPRLLDAARQFPAVTVTGPRQSGKSTLCKALFLDHRYLNLEQPDLREFALEDPRGFLATHPGPVIIDEFQHAPQLASWLQVLIDENPQPGRWILTGSQNLAITQSISQSLAGRTAILHLLPLSYSEMERFDGPPGQLEDVLLRGGYPRIHDQSLVAADWLSAYVATYVERDVRSISRVESLTDFQRFLGLCAGRSGQLLNYSALASDCGISQPTAKAWLSILEASFLVDTLPPWAGNIRKRLVKSPKLFLLDSGLLCWLLGIRTSDQLLTHPLRGAIFETWAYGEALKAQTLSATHQPMSHYRDQAGLEVDLIIEFAARAELMEFKSSRTFHSSMLKPLSKAASLWPEEIDCGMTLCYGGDQEQQRQSARILPWHQIDRWVSAL